MGWSWLVSPLWHHRQDGLPEVSTGNLPIVPPLQGAGGDLEVVLRHHLIPQPLRIPVEVHSLHQSTGTSLRRLSSWH